MSHHDWADLPGEVREAVQDRIGVVAKAIPNRRGQTCDLAATVHLADGQRVFLKGVHGVSLRMRRLRTETKANQLAPEVAPAVLFQVDVADWLVVGFDHIEGRPASFAPGSADLSLIATTMEQLGALRAPEVPSLRNRWAGGQSWRRLAEETPAELDEWSRPRLEELARWEALAPELVVGESLLHTDLHPDQFLIDTADRVHVIDWAWPASGASWVDLAYGVIRLIGAGHRPVDAERWAAGISSWSGAADEAVTAFAVYVAGLWSYRAAEDPGDGAPWRAKIAREFADWRLTSR